MTSWLSRQKKQTLLDLSKEAGFPQHKDTLKDDVIERLDDHLQKNVTELSSKLAFEPYYGSSRRTPGRPSASRPDASDEEGGMSSPTQAIVKSVSAVTTQATTPAAVRTPAATHSSALPPSPAYIAQEVEQRTLDFYDRIAVRFADSSIPETIKTVRENCSSVMAIQTALTFFEATSLQIHILPWKIAFPLKYDISPYARADYIVKLPDLFILLEGYFWSTTLLWATTSLFLPGLLAYFFNLSVKHVKKHGLAYDVPLYRIDPMTFNIAKALITSLVYSRGVTFAVLDHATVARVDRSIWGGYQSILVGCYVGILTSLYEAAQRK
ncbi:hypothetical protein K431DRAFT_265672 [Polychaeton citri CBS 116435]|uniref:Uncharacterized protein n=1 Tax=Polychaeton citri CBS 116435 TaxID=1314669 RepID=A0A9P4UQM4_9PEZI|nr:hypothetical protein K431DRAFT_265672 [Polychaeton citri CBS 116435]